MILLLNVACSCIIIFTVNLWKRRLVSVSFITMLCNTQQKELTKDKMAPIFGEQEHGILPSTGHDLKINAVVLNFLLTKISQPIFVFDNHEVHSDNKTVNQKGDKRSTDNNDNNNKVDDSRFYRIAIRQHLMIHKHQNIKYLH